MLNAYVVSRSNGDSIERRVTEVDPDFLPRGDVTIDVHWSSLNYKDALAATGHPGVARKLPHIPGIDAAGVIVQSQVPNWRPGDPVIVTGYELGAGQAGGWCEQIRVPADWVVPLPSGLTLREAMIYGTAGFTAAQCVRAIQDQHVEPDDGEVLVTGASGGVGCLSVKLLAQQGYKVVAATGKQDAADWLRSLGASRVIGRDECRTSDTRPLLATSWAGAIDTVGGPTLEYLVRSTKINGCVAACGMVGGSDLQISVYPFILRGVTLAGITSAWCPYRRRVEIWQKLAHEWKVDGLDELTQEVSLLEIDGHVDRILSGQVRGRIVIRIV